MCEVVSPSVAYLQVGGKYYAYLLVGGKHPFYHRLGGNPGFVHLSYLIHPKKASTFAFSHAVRNAM
eukprot:4103766-Prymnesium_polylepis.3